MILGSDAPSSKPIPLLPWIPLDTSLMLEPGQMRFLNIWSAPLGCYAGGYMLQNCYVSLLRSPSTDVTKGINVPLHHQPPFLLFAPHNIASKTFFFMPGDTLVFLCLLLGHWFPSLASSHSQAHLPHPPPRPSTGGGHVWASEVPAENQCHAGANGRGKTLPPSGVWQDSKAGQRIQTARM